ncbi:MAG: hypothetical protein AAFQ14_04205 [Cyanobacteria bacterium J06621_12]
MINQGNNQIKASQPNSAKIAAMVMNLGAIILSFPLGIISVSASSDADYSFLIDSDWRSCQQISLDYQEVYAFETASFYVNICQKDDTYFYSGEAKQSDVNSIFIPAKPLEQNRGFQAQNGNVSYIVILPFPQQNNQQSSAIEPEEAILTIKRNDRLVAVESSLNKYCHQSEAIALDKIKLNPLQDNQLATIPQQQDIGWNFLSDKSGHVFSGRIIDSDTSFDFYRIDGKLHQLTTCS